MSSFNLCMLGAVSALLPWAQATNTIKIRNKMGGNYNGKMESGTTISLYGTGGYCHIHGPVERDTTKSCNTIYPTNHLLNDGAPLFGIGGTSTGWPDLVTVDGGAGEDGVQLTQLVSDGVQIDHFKLVSSNYDNNCGNGLGDGVRNCITLLPGKIYVFSRVFQKKGKWTMELTETTNSGDYTVTYAAQNNNVVYNLNVDVTGCQYFWNAALNRCSGVANYGTSNRRLSSGAAKDMEAEDVLFVDQDGGSSNGLFSTLSPTAESPRGNLRGHDLE